MREAPDAPRVFALTLMTGPAGDASVAPVSKLHSWAAALLALTLVLLPSCLDPHDRPADWETIHTLIIVPSCATSSCHSSLSKTAGVNLEDIDGAYDFLIRENFVIPGDVEFSGIMPLLQARGRIYMPPDAPLPKADVDLIRDWIAQGALR